MKKMLTRLALGLVVVSGLSTQLNAQAPVRVGGTIAAPQKIKHVEPVPPPEVRTGMQAVVILEITIGPDGLVRNARPIRPALFFEKAAIDAVRQWQFRPTMIDGVAMPVVMTVDVRFGPGALGATSPTPTATPAAPIAPEPRTVAPRPRTVEPPARTGAASRTPPPAPSLTSAPASTSEAASTPGVPAEPDLPRLTAVIDSPSATLDAKRHALRQRALLNATTGRLGFAHKDVDALLAMDPADDEAHFARALAFFVGNPNEAVRWFSQVLQLKPARADAYRGRAWAHLVLGDHAAALKDFDQLLQLEPGDADSYRGRGWAHLQGQRYEPAAADFAELITRSGGNVEGTLLRGISYYFLGRAREARLDFRTTVRFRPGKNGSTTYNTLIIDDWRRFRRVLPMLDERTRQNPRDVDGLLALGTAYFRDPTGAQGGNFVGPPPATAFDRAIKVSPNDIDALMLRAIVHAHPINGYNGRSAIDDLTEVIRLDPQHGEAYFRRALLRALDMQSLTAAIEDAEKARTLSPNDPVLVELVARLKVDQRDRALQKERAAITQAERERAEVQLSLMILGTIYMRILEKQQNYEPSFGNFGSDYLLDEMMQQGRSRRRR